MDLSIVAAVGSFVFSERVLKPKATVLFILGIVLAYDLTTKTQDVSSLRVYRGPSLLALSLMLFAYSLRTWRRNGVACDELIFLPGTQHGHQTGVEGPLIETIPSGDDSESSNESSLNSSNKMYVPVPLTRSISAQQEVESPSSLIQTDEIAAEGRSLEMISFGSNENDKGESTPLMVDESNNGNDSSDHVSEAINPISKDNLEEGNFIDEDDEQSLLGKGAPLHTLSSNTVDDNDGTDVHGVKDVKISERSTNEHPETGSTGPRNRNCGIIPRIKQWAEQHPQIAQLWTFFFNRSGGPNNANATYAPSGPAVFGAALDLSMPVLFNFHVFILTFNHVQRPDYNGSDLYAKTLPIAFLTVLYARVVIPPGRRLRFWGTMKFTFTAPLHKVGVRDEFIGDCLTSWVRIGQDIVFATIYYFIVIWGTLSRRYGLPQSGEILAESWFVHNVVLPLCAILPLWLKFLQTLRQAYDARKRWPYLGNAFKYLSAALVIIYGTRHPDQRRSSAWIACFIVAMLYQIFWDVVMDWQLFEIPTEISVLIDGNSSTQSSSSSATAATETSTSSMVSSLRPSSKVLHVIRVYIVQPIQHFCQQFKAQVSGIKNIQLRQQRLYSEESFYWRILVYNSLTRFTWMCCFIPAYHVSRGETVVLTSTSDVTSYWGVLLPAAELFRRTLWGFLYMEKETIKMMEADSIYQRVGLDGDIFDDDEIDEMTMGSKVQKNQFNLIPTWLGKQQQIAHEAATTRAKWRKQLSHYLFLFELSVWAASFIVLGILLAV